MRKSESRRAFTIIEVMVATVIFIVAILGTSVYRYSAALSARRADLQTTAARAALLLCEAWRGVSGDTAFDPVTALSSDLTINTGTGPDVPDGFTSLGSYSIDLEGTDYYATLSYEDIGSPGSSLRALNVVVSWDQFGRGTHSFTGANKSYKLTTYVENPSS